MIRRFLVIVMMSCCLTAAAAEPLKPPTLQQSLDFARAWLDAQRMYEQIPGMSAAIIHDHKLLWSGGVGHADPATRKPASADTLYSICSVSKLFTSIGVMQLRDEGKVALDDPVSKHLSWFRMKAAPEGREATVRGILTHSAGIPRESDFPYWTGEFDFPTREKIIERVGAQEPLFASDRYMQYSNLGLTLAGEIIGAASGQPYEAYVRERILKPLDLRSTYTEIPIQERGKRLAVGYSALRRDGKRVALPLFQARGIAPAAGFASTVDDLAHFAMWQFRALGSSKDAILDPRTLREMQRAQFVEGDLDRFWGLGFSVYKEDGKVFVGHGGSCPGFRTAFTLKPDEKVGVVIAANASGVNTGRYAKVIYDIVAPALKRKGDAAPTNVASVDAYIGSYDAFPWSGETLFFAWGDGLGSLSLPSTDPMRDMEKYRRVGEHKFQRIRKDDSLADTITFEVGADGRATRFWAHSNPYSRMK